MSNKTIEYTLKFTLLLLFLAGVLFQINLGLADNGDFYRSMKMFTSAPAMENLSLPVEGSEAWLQRYFNFWIPYWKLDWQAIIPTSSVFLLWSPGIALNDFLRSDTDLFIPFVSIAPKLFLLALVFFTFRWIDTHFEQKNRILLYITLALPLILIFTTTDYLSYLNSFYEETASFIYLYALLASFIFFSRKPTSSIRLSLCLLTLLLLSTGKSSNLYWPIIFIPFLFLLRLRTEQLSAQVMAKSTVFGAMLIFLITASSYVFTNSQRFDDARYHSLFYGALTFSEAPEEHKNRLGLENNTSCVGQIAYVAESQPCMESYLGKTSLIDTLSVYWEEPEVLIKTLHHTASNMQDISIDYLGKYSRGHPEALANLLLPFQPVSKQQIWPHVYEQRYWKQESESLFNLWSSLKYKFFPTGGLLLVTLAIWLFWFTLGLFRKGMEYELSLVGSIVTIACIGDMFVAIFGAGKFELIKHLFLSNLLFDIALLAFINTLALRVFQRSNWSNSSTGS